MSWVPWMLGAWMGCNVVLAYGIGYSRGWLKCSDEHVDPALDGWERALDGWRSAIDGWKETIEGDDE